MHAVNDWAIALAGTPWVFLVVYLFATIDGFFPPIPSESVIIALATLFVQDRSADFWLLGAAAAAGAFSGDQIAYEIGKHIPVRRIRFMRSERAVKAIEWAEQALERRGGSFIIAARYIPIGRVAVNMTAGTTGYPRLRFTGLAAIAAVSWSIYSVVLGIGAGMWLKNHPTLALVAGVAAGLVLGVVVDRVMALLRGRRGRRVVAEASGVLLTEGVGATESDAESMVAGAAE